MDVYIKMDVINHYITGGRNSYLGKCSDNILIYHYITGGRRKSYLSKYSDNILIYNYITGGRRMPKHECQSIHQQQKLLIYLVGIYWKKRRRSHRLFLVFKSLNGLIDWNFNCNHFKDMHDYNTRFNNNICKPQSKRSWGQHRLVCHAVDDWNALPDGIRIFRFCSF